MNGFSSFNSLHPSFRLKRSFTLIELLVVVAIIAILAGLLLPALNKAKKRAQSIRCIGKLKDLGLTRLQYSNDNKEFILLTWFSSSIAWSRYKELGYVKYGAGHYARFRCDWDNNKATAASSANDFGYGVRGAGGGSCGNYRSGGTTHWIYDSFKREGETSTSKVLFMKRVDKPSSCIGMGDSYYVPKNQQTSTPYDYNSDNCFWFFVHNDRCNMSFMDGSARSCTPFDLRASVRWEIGPGNTKTRYYYNSSMVKRSYKINF